MYALKRLARIIAIAREELWVVVIYGSAIGLFSLIVPIAAQGLVTIVSFGTVLQPIVVLAFAVFILLSAAAVFRIFQAILAENIQQRIFARVALDLAERLPKVQLSALDNRRATELVNRFFDVLTIQKASATILFSGIGVFLQATFGMILLAVYHPLLLMFDIAFVISLFLIIYMPWKKALRSALEESDRKYYVAAWLEEVARIPLLFKFQRYLHYSIEQADEQIVKYLSARQSHFKRLLIHIGGTLVLQVVSSTLLLVLGGLLVINNQLTLGQLVAAEIVVTALGNGVNKLGKYLENIYDLIASADKVGILMDLPIEEDDDIIRHEAIAPKPFKSAPSIDLDDVSLDSLDGTPLIKGLTAHIKAGSLCAIVGPKGAGKSLLLDMLLGLRTLEKGLILYNQLPLKEYPRDVFRRNIYFLRDVQFFDGSILENLVMNQANISLEEIHDYLLRLNLADAIAKLPEGLNSILYGNHSQLTSVELLKLMFVRGFLVQPKLLVLDEALDLLPDDDWQLVIEILKEDHHEWTLVATTRREDIANHFEQRIFI